ncbi:hypothetical protein [Actinoplanes sp. G11-F43]
MRRHARPGAATHALTSRAAITVIAETGIDPAEAVRVIQAALHRRPA